jgi:Cu+-exporting ATPase
VVTDAESIDTAVAASDMVRLAASAERNSEHPIGGAIVANASERGLELSEADEVEAVVGHGIVARVENSRVAVGSRSLMRDEDVNHTVLEPLLKRLEVEGKTVVAVAVNGEPAGVIAVADPVKPDSVTAISELKRLGLKPVMITGDHEVTARAIADQVGIEEVISGVLPDRKSDEVKRLQAGEQVVAMVGDGINDAPALAQADVGIAIGTGTDIAIESADITLIQGELSAVVKAVRLSRATFRKIKQNLFWAYFYNAIAIPFAILGMLHPLIAEGAMAFSSVNVVSNSARLRRVDIKSGGTASMNR